MEALIDRGFATLKQISEAIEEKGQPPCGSPGLRASQRDLARKLVAAGDGGVGGELAILSDRLVDNINTLAHVVGRASEFPSGDRAPSPPHGPQESQRYG